MNGNKNLRVLETVADLATLTVTPAPVATAPASNLQNPRRGAVCRVVGASTMTIAGNFDRARLVDGLVINRHNFSSTATWRIRFFNAINQAGAIVYTHGPVTIDPPVALGSFVLGDGPLARNRFTSWALAFATHWFAKVATLSFDILITDTGNTAGFLEASRLLLGARFEPLVNLSYGHSHKWVERAEVVRSGGGSLSGDAPEPVREFRFALDWLETDAQREALSELGRRVGKRQDIFLSVFPEHADRALERDYAMLCRLQEQPEISHPHAIAFRGQQLVFTEA